MASDIGIVDTIATALHRLGGLCDTGFALAIHIRLTAPSLLYQTYSQDWADHYSTKGYMLSDPVVHWGLTHTGRVDWANLTDVDPEGVIPAAVSFGLTHGWTYATGPANSRTIAGMTRSGRSHDAAEIAEIQTIVDNIHAATEGIEHFPHDLLDRLRLL